MIKIENTVVYGIREAIRGARNSWDSHSNDDSRFEDGRLILGDANTRLMTSLIRSGDSHAKALRMITVWFDMTAPRYFWTEFDTYRHVVRCSESTMHTITKKLFTSDDFSTDGGWDDYNCWYFDDVINSLNDARDDYLKSVGQKEYQMMHWRDIIQLLPQSYNQKSTICTNYQTLRNMYLQRKGHKLREWEDFRAWVETLPYAKELICCE